MCSARGVIGFPTPALSSSFPTGAAVPTEHRPRAAFASRFILFDFAPLQSPFVFVPAEAFRASAPSMGFSSLFATSTDGVLATSFPSSPPFRPRRFSRPRRVAPPSALWVYFTPQPRPGFALQGVLHSHSRNRSSRSRALSSLALVRYRQLPTDATFQRPALKALIRARVRCRRTGV